MKRISVLLTILLILSSFPMSSASAKVSNTVRQDAELFTNSLTYSPTLPTTYLTEPTVSDGIIGNLKDGYKLCYQYTPAPPWMKAFYYQYGKYIFVNHNNASESGHGFYIQKDDEKLMLSEAFDKGITDIEEVVAIILPKDISTFNPMNIVDTEKVEGDWKDLFSEFDFPQDENNTKATMPTVPTSESATGYTEPTATTEDPTGHCTEFDLPYSPDFAVALANYTNNLMGESLSVSDIDLFHYDQTTVVFGLSDNLCTEGHENIDGYHFENWNFFPHEANKTGYCVYYNGTIYNLPDAVSNNIMTASALASIIPHSSKLEGSTQPTETTESSQPIITEPTDPTTTTEDPTGHCTDNEEMFRQIFATELAEYSNELGYEEPFSIEDVEFFYRNSGSMAVFALRDKWCTVSEETIGNYKFTNPSFFGNEKNKTGLCVYYNNTIFSIAKAVQEGYVTAEFLASVIPNTTFVGSTETTEATQPTQITPTEVTEPTTDPEPLWMTAMRAFKVYLGSLYDGYYDVSKTTYLGEIGEDCELLYGWGYEEPVSGGYIQIGSYKIWAPATTPFQSAGLFIYKNGEIKLLKDAFADGGVTDVERIISLIKAADKSLGFEITDITQTDNTEPASTQSATTETVPAVKNDIRNAKFSPISAKTYTGKAITPAVKVTYGGKTLVKNKDYTLSYGNNKNVGTATITVKGKGNYTGSKKLSFKIVKAANTMTAKATAKTVKYSQLKKAKQTVSVITVKKAIGKVSYKKASGKSFFTVNTKTGKITIKKGTKKGTYTIKVNVTAAGNSNYKSASKTVTVKIKVK